MNIYLKILIGLILGGLAGYSYYYFIGCSSGTCPITSNWYISTAYGAAMGFVAVFPSKKKQSPEKKENS